VRQKATQSALPELPVCGVADTLRQVLRDGHVVFTAEPGSGKTTLVPLLLLDEPWLTGRRILMLEPRRPAARMAARRMAALLGEEVGATVGYQVRFERRISAATRIEVLTEGLLLRRLQADPELTGVGLLIFDEFHERNLQGDLALALSLDVVGALRDDLRLLAMSASLDTAPLAAMMGAQVVCAGGRQYPVAIEYATVEADPRDPVPACLRALAGTIAERDGDVLVFLPGRREIERLRDAVEQRWGAQLDALALYGELPAAAQDQVLCGGGQRRRVIAATDIAETSLTIEGVHAVVDSGLARKPRFDPASGLTRLETRRISKASALQRAGRAGRLGPGRCVRVWSEARQARLPDWTPPEILEADLAAPVLELAAWGVTQPHALRWLDPPPPAHWQQAVDLLRQLGALDRGGRITPAGRAMVRFPAHPRLAHVLAAAASEPDRRLAADVVALLSERDPLGRGSEGGRSADIGLRLDALAALRRGDPLPAGCRRGALRQIDKAAQQYHRLYPDTAVDGPGGLSVAACVALAYPERLAMGTSADGRRFLMRNGRAALLAEDDPLRGAAFLAIAGVDAGRRDGVIWSAAPLARDTLEALLGDAIESRRDVRWDAAQGDVVARRQRRLGALLLGDEAVPLEAEDPLPEILLGQIREQGLAAFFADPVELRSRVQLARRLEPAGDWPDFSEQGLRDALEDWLLPWLRPGEGARQLRGIELREVLEARLGWERLQRLERWLPTHYQTPAGTRRRIVYSDAATPYLAVPLQEMLGLGTGPQIADGRVPLVLHLLSPAGRPLQVTSDLAGFWQGAYAEVKKEMRGRYPKHYWPDDPANAQATRFTKRRM
jgi:ATP-dependent helicase HrpB